MINENTFFQSVIRIVLGLDHQAEGRRRRGSRDSK